MSSWLPHLKKLSITVAAFWAAYFIYLAAGQVVYSDFEATAMANAWRVIELERRIGLFLGTRLAGMGHYRCAAPARQKEGWSSFSIGLTSLPLRPSWRPFPSLFTSWTGQPTAITGISFSSAMALRLSCS